ncbi:MAG: peptide chain release factor N(5)-glutamine methyltransferase [Lysobacter sp.]|nr:peptide chain release factor N(5)-glutamine methyltransferase [Lysobacter sp.]
MSVRGLLVAAGSELGGDESAREVEVLLAHALGRDRAWLYAHADDALPVEQAIEFHRLLTRRAAGEPVAYLVGRREFWSLDLVVTPDVLIPRHETELLVELALQKIPQGKKMEIADLGTGSGAVALALARERPQARVLATDISEAALTVARRNAQRLGITHVEFAQGDWCAALGERRFGLIVANPPYVAEGDLHMIRGDLRFEPPVALASGAAGLDAIAIIVRGAPAHLQPGGWLLFEHGFEQGSAARSALEQSGFVDVSTYSDLEGRERVSIARCDVG